MLYRMVGNGDADDEPKNMIDVVFVQDSNQNKDGIVSVLCGRSSLLRVEVEVVPRQSV